MHFIGHNFDFIGQPVIEGAGVNNSRSDKVNVVFCGLIELKGRFTGTDKVLGLGYLDQRVFYDVPSLSPQPGQIPL